MASAYFFFFPFFFIGIDLFSSLCKILRRAPSLEMLWPTAFSNLYVVVSRGLVKQNIGVPSVFLPFRSPSRRPFPSSCSQVSGYSTCREPRPRRYLSKRCVTTVDRARHRELDRPTRCLPYALKGVIMYRGNKLAQMAER